MNKAFDSVDLGYIERALRKYGFGPNLIKYIKTLYVKLTAKLLINGTRSRIIRIIRGIKQGDALSCAIFIICIDPLIRNINSERLILTLKLRTRITKEKVKYKSEERKIFFTCSFSLCSVINKQTCSKKLFCLLAT